MALWEHFPYTNYHSLNLDWIVTKVKELNAKVAALEAWEAQHKGEYQELLQRVVVLENEIDTFETQVRSEFQALKLQLDADFAEQKAEMDQALADTEAAVNEQIELLTAEVNAAINGLDARFAKLAAEIKSALVNLQLQFNEAIAYLDNRILSNNQYVFDYVENRLDQFIDEFPDLINIEVYNPFRGSKTGLQTAINDQYDMSCIYGLTAIQFDQLDITAEEFDDEDLTAREFDQYGYNMLHYPDPRYYMFDPFTGEINLVKNVVQELAALHTGAESVNVTEFEALDLTAEEFDATEITAFNFDWYSKTLLTA